MRKNEVMRRRVGCRAAFPLCLALVVGLTFSTSATYACYATSSTVEAQARVARWEVDMEPDAGQSDDLVLDGTLDAPRASYSFELSNRSEVVAQVTLQLELSEPLQSGVDVYVENDAGDRLDWFESADGLTYEFDAGQFDTESEPCGFSLVFAGKEQGSVVENQNDIAVTLSAAWEQVV